MTSKELQYSTSLEERHENQHLHHKGGTETFGHGGMVASSRKAVMQTTKRQRKSMTDKREEMYGRYRLSIHGTPLHSSLASVAPYRKWRRLSQTRAYGATTLSVDVVELYSCRYDLGSCLLAKAGSGLVNVVTCRPTVWLRCRSSDRKCRAMFQ